MYKELGFNKVAKTNYALEGIYPGEETVFSPHDKDLRKYRKWKDLLRKSVSNDDVKNKYNSFIGDTITYTPRYNVDEEGYVDKAKRMGVNALNTVGKFFGKEDNIMTPVPKQRRFQTGFTLSSEKKGPWYKNDIEHVTTNFAGQEDGFIDALATDQTNLFGSGDTHFTNNIIEGPRKKTYRKSDKERFSEYQEKQKKDGARKQEINRIKRENAAAHKALRDKEKREHQEKMLLDPMYDMPAARPSTFAVDRSVVNTDGSITPRGNKLKSMGNLKQKYKKDMAALNRRESIHNEAFEADQASRRKFFGGRGLNAIKEKIRDFGVGLEKNKMKRGFEQGKRDVLKTYSEDLEEQIT